jgi:hypothetical protein
MENQDIARVATDSRRYVVDEKTGCWRWRGAKLRSGHGSVRIAGKSLLAHRVFFEHHGGLILPGLLVHHVCSEPSCVNPHHLRLVSPAEHARLHAELHGKLSFACAAQIRRLWGSGRWTQQELATRFAVDPSTISRIVRGLTWRATDGAGASYLRAAQTLRLLGRDLYDVLAAALLLQIGRACRREWSPIQVLCE